ncbi:MAG: hypothetical protein ABIN97_18370 [Ginsengibacter sp.]
MKKILIISPHFPPSNLAGVHRSRLFAQHLPSFGWEPVILTVHEKFYEEEPDWNLAKLLPEHLRIEKTSAFKVTKPRLVGDIGLRAFFQLYKKGKEIIKKEKIDFLYIPIPSFYCALLGRLLHSTTGIAYGIDYIDPWVHHFPGSDKLFSRHWFSTKLARLLEPVAIKRASLITGVAEGYYTPVLERNPDLKVVTGAMPYGGEVSDHEKVNKLNIKPYLFKKNNLKFQLVYAGAMLPNAYKPLEKIFECIKENAMVFENTQFHFIGTGRLANDPHSYNIKSLAEKYNLWNTVVFEYPQRISYLDVLVHLNLADGIFILGSTEAHYTPSKVYQAVLSAKPIIAVLHEQSTAVQVIQQSKAGVVLSFAGEEGLDKIKQGFTILFNQYRSFCKHFNVSSINPSAFDAYSAKAITKKLAGLLERQLRLRL